MDNIDIEPFSYSDNYTSLLITIAGFHSLDNLQHMVRTSFQMRQLLLQLQHPYSDKEMNAIVRAAAFHDIGKVFVQKDILEKPSKLNVAEFEVMKTHTERGTQFASISSTAPEPLFASYLAILCRSHHERWDGTGYPDGLVGEAIPYPARLLAIVDVYDALTHDRPYRQAMTHEAAMKIIGDGKGSHFDPAIVKAFLYFHDTALRPFPKSGKKQSSPVTRK